MKDSEAQMRAEHILGDLGKHPCGIFTLEEITFLTHRCKRVAGAPIVPVLAFTEVDLKELQRIATRVREASRKPLSLLPFPKR